MKRAFTLIELLVVIAIIGVLAAILFPVFARAKESAKKTTCLSNMKQLGTAFGLYASDADDMVPAMTEGGKSSPTAEGGSSKRDRIWFWLGWMPFELVIGVVILIACLVGGAYFFGCQAC